MKYTKYAQFLALFLAVAALAGCIPEEKTAELPPRPVAGDTVSPYFLPGKVNRAKSLFLLSVKLWVEREDEESTKTRFLQMSEVPYERQPTATLTFKEGDKVLETMKNVVVVRNC